MFSLLPVMYHVVANSISRLRDEEGQTMAEYGILIAVIAIAVVLAAIFLGSKITGLFNTAGNSL